MSTDTSTWQPATPTGSTGSGNGGDPPRGGDTAQARARAHAREARVAAALAAPFRGLAPRRRPNPSGETRRSPWQADPPPLVVLWERTHAAALAELARPLPADPSRWDRAQRVGAACWEWGYGAAVRVVFAAVGYALAWLAAEPHRAAPVALLAVWWWLS